MTSPDPLLEVHDLRTSFDTPRGVLRAVDGVSFRLAEGETLGIVGESGSGKSVLARTVMRLVPSTATVEGRASFQGRDLLDIDEREARAIWGSEIAMVFQDPSTSLNPVMRVGRQITESLTLHLGLRGDEARARAVDLLAGVGIPEPRARLRTYPHELSGGMRQRVSIAIAIACSPRLLLADEPTTALDVTIQRQILDLLGSLQQAHGMAMVLITHDLGVVAGRTGRIIVMYGGRVMETAPTATLFEDPRHPYTVALLGSTPRLEHSSHARLTVIPGRPLQVVDPPPGCRFAPRCRYAQPRCVAEDPPLLPDATPGHQFACFYPVGTEAGAAALAANLAVGRTAAGLAVADETEVA